MKKLTSLILSLTMIVTMIPGLAFAADGGQDYAGKTVILYSGNLRGDIDQYAKLKTAKAEIADTADAVYLVDAGNYLQGTTYANTSRGEAIYDLMDEAGYDVAAMGAYEFAYGDASTGQKWHGNFTKFYTQKMLYEGVPEVFEYGKNGSGSVKGSLPRCEGDICPASYLNFLITNEGVIVPQYGDEYDEKALSQLRAIFPEKKVVGVYSREIVYGGGNIHCITQQVPR